MKYTVGLCRFIFQGVIVLFAYPLLFHCALALAQTPYYQGKTITVLQGRDPGGTGDMRARAITQFLPKYIPGNPTIVHEYMPGTGGLRVANQMYAANRPEGLTIGSVGAGMLSSPLLGVAGAKYDIARFFYLGAADSGGHYLFYTRKEAGISSLEKLRVTPGIRIGAQSVGHSNYNIPRILAYLMGMKEPKFVTGYSSPEIDVALARGEVDGRMNQADSLLLQNLDWVEKGLVDIHVILQIPKEVKHPRFGHVPELESFARLDQHRKLVTLQRTFRMFGSPFVFPPATPKERVEILQEAMRKVFRDPQFPKEFKKLVGDDPEIVMPEVLEKNVKEIPREPEVIELLKKLAGPGPLPPG